jgi:hypothetical protein
LAVVDPASELSALYKITVTGLLASTCPVTVPSGRGVGVGDSTGVAVKTGVGVSNGVGDSTGVLVSTGVEGVPIGVAVSTGVEGVPFGVAVSTGVDTVPTGVGVSTGVEGVPTGVGVSTGVETVPTGVGDSNGVGVGALPIIVKLVPMEGRFVRTLSPLETRAVHSIADWPACRAVTVKVNTVPLVVALLPLLPAIATMKLPFCGSLIAVAASVPKRPAMTMLLDFSKAAL